MHPRNPYRNPLDFTALSAAYPPLSPHVITNSSSGRKTIDFRNEEAQRRLTEAIMLRDFGVVLNIPSNRLCPPVPHARINYVLWLQDIVYAHQTILGPSSRRVRGLDIGTGATAIYPILACKSDPSWEMVATELDDVSYGCACNNVSSNNMDVSVKVEKASVDGPILFPVGKQNFDFSMCNPPFYGSQEEVAQSAESKELPPNAVCTGAEIEMIFSQGGEEGFVRRMVEESERLQTRCKWYTSMLGKMSSVSTIVHVLRARSIMNYAITEFVQGQTRRWAIAWSFSDTHLPDVYPSFLSLATFPLITPKQQTVARISSITPKHALYTLLPPRNTLSQLFPSFSPSKVENALFEVLQAIPRVSATITIPTSLPAPSSASAPSTPASGAAKGDSPSTSTSLPVIFVEAQENTWSRSARRRNQNCQLRKVGDDHDEASVSAKDHSQGHFYPSRGCEGGVLCSVECQWIYGSDRGLYESFVGHVGRKVGAALKAGT
ncbi:hypothetical protein CPB84DRAFT_1817537 [Gymnopilus junonius]|uniref:U6 small nuclear RNA (adenine-(43)-N(6))-methyltransferase n=1 Tax=Gymnopilus junonius TaxID=109634 RepID=A0A9P5TI63_GYMJU|nr:hypothetical protein CPB84DRAFT_1817537 [Gymnopilus junonius]